MSVFLEKKDKKLLDELIKISQSIYSCYEKLINLELNNKKSSDEYRKILDYITLALETEKEKYQSLNLDVNKCLLYKEYLCSDEMHEDYYYSNDFAITEQDEDYKIIIRRVIINILDYITANDLSVFPSQVFSLLENFGINNAEQILTNKYNTSVAIIQSFDKEIFFNFILMINKLFGKEKLLIYKENLLKVKYNTIFLNKDIESEMLIQNFNMNNQIFDSDIIKKYYNINDYYYNNSKENYILEVVKTYIDDILNTPNDEYINSNLSLGLKYIYLNSLLYLVDDYENILTLILYFRDMVDYPGFYENRQRYSKSIINISKLFSSIKLKRKNESLSLNKYFN